MTTRTPHNGHQAIILAAGRGERLRPLTDHTPKPLLRAGGRRLIDYQIEALMRAGISDITINISHLADAFHEAFGSEITNACSVHFSKEPPGALETAGGIALAIHRGLIGSDPFVVTNGDVYCDIDYRDLHLEASDVCHLVLVDNPEYHKAGDFEFRDGRVVADQTRVTQRLTYAGIGVFRPRMFRSLCQRAEKSPHNLPPRQKLAELMRAAIDANRVSATHYRGTWVSVDTVSRLNALDRMLTTSDS